MSNTTIMLLIVALLLSLLASIFYKGADDKSSPESSTNSSPERNWPSLVLAIGAVIAAVATMVTVSYDVKTINYVIEASHEQGISARVNAAGLTPYTSTPCNLKLELVKPANEEQKPLLVFAGQPSDIVLNKELVAALCAEQLDLEEKDT